MEKLGINFYTGLTCEKIMQIYFSEYRYGDDDSQIRTYEHILHPEYNPSNINNDVCLLKLDEPLNMTNSNSVKAIGLNRRDAQCFQ